MGVFLQAALPAGTQRICLRCGAARWVAWAAGGSAAAPSASAAAASDVRRASLTLAANRVWAAKFRRAGGYPYARMRRAPNRQERPPHVGAVMLAKALAGVFLIFVVCGVGTAAAGYFQFDKLFPPADAPLPGGGKAPPPLAVPKLPEVKPGGARTLLLLGSDHRAKTSFDGRRGDDKPLSDTIVLVRLDPKRKRIAVLSIPRDLAVTIPGVGEGIKINAAYTDGGPSKTLATVKLLFKNATGKDLAVNSVIDVDFNGFQRAVNYIGGVYVDVDRRYYNPNGTGYSAIDVQPGYQLLKGKDALAYVRYRHTDSDLFRNARQQDFLRQAGNQPAVRKLKSLSSAAHLVQIMRRYFRFDKQFLTKRNIAGLLKTGLYLALGHAPVNQIKLQGITESPDPVTDTRLFISNENLAQGLQGVPDRRPDDQPDAQEGGDEGQEARVGVEAVRPGERRGAGRGDGGAWPSAGCSFPFYFPTCRASGSAVRDRHAAAVQGRRRSTAPSATAYRIVVALGPPGEYYGVQGMTWRHPPILAEPDRVRIVNGRKLLMFYDGPHLRLVGWRTHHGVLLGDQHARPGDLQLAAAGHHAVAATPLSADRSARSAGRSTLPRRTALNTVRLSGASATSRTTTPGSRSARTRSGSSVTAWPLATSASRISRSVERWRMSGSKPPSARQARIVSSA